MLHKLWTPKPIDLASTRHHHEKLVFSFFAIASSCGHHWIVGMIDSSEITMPSTTIPSWSRLFETLLSAAMG
jgi:hypothetical protein